MTLDEARAAIGRKVVYRPGHTDVPEEGVITSVNASYVFVRYGTDTTNSVATSPNRLEFIS